MEAAAHQHDVLADLDAGLLLGSFELVDVDRAEIRDVAQIEADGLAAEPVERELVDRVAAILDVQRGVDVRTDVLQHREVVDRVRHGIARLAEARRLRHLVRDVREDDRRREERMGGHLVLEADREVDEGRPPLALGEKRFFGGAHPSLLTGRMRSGPYTVSGRMRSGPYTISGRLASGPYDSTARRRSTTRRDSNSVVGSVFGALDDDPGRDTARGLDPIAHRLCVAGKTTSTKDGRVIRASSRVGRRGRDAPPESDGWSARCASTRRRAASSRG